MRPEARLTPWRLRPRWSAVRAIFLNSKRLFIPGRELLARAYSRRSSRTGAARAFSYPARKMLVLPQRPCRLDGSRLTPVNEMQ
jgi:hypothetical protein